MNTYYIAGYPVTDELYHFGILGMRWGIRRYQNKDGTLTAVGKKRYAKELKQKEEDKKRAFEEEKRKAETQIAKDFKNVDFYVDDDPTSKRGKDAADTGLRALERLGRLSQYGGEDLNSVDENSMQSYREWFIWEDQTVGLATISDLVNQGKDKTEIRRLIDEAFDYSRKYGYPYSENKPLNYAIFNLAENGNIKDTERGRQYGKYVDEFIDACIAERRVKHGINFSNSYSSMIV